MTTKTKSRTETRNLPCELSEGELKERGFQLAKVVQDIAAETTRQGDQEAQMKATLAALGGQKARLASAVARREEFRDVMVDIYFDLDDKTVETVRQDTGEVIFTRPMTDEERQMDLPVGADA